ncbi:hypothetical protein STAS_17269 [Striga asiatica]|uniref:DUF641 domain-containing protein n=1 Tax=Striga asiatica TaxID=4170 RepID=A0A5A7Q683_STRAF|nr:hypothetical protein STAS_17269 [Striga asiatica]
MQDYIDIRTSGNTQWCFGETLKLYELRTCKSSLFGGRLSLSFPARGFHPDQKVVVVKPDPVQSKDNSSGELICALLPSLLATVSSFEASYLQFQVAHVPEINQNALEAADMSIVLILGKLAKIKSLYKDSKKRSVSEGGFDFPAVSFLEFWVQENKSTLRVLETLVNLLQSQMGAKDDESSGLRKKLDKIRFAMSIYPEIGGEKGKCRF